MVLRYDTVNLGLQPPITWQPVRTSCIEISSWRKPLSDTLFEWAIRRAGRQTPMRPQTNLDVTLRGSRDKWTNRSERARFSTLRDAHQTHERSGVRITPHHSPREVWKLRLMSRMNLVIFKVIQDSFELDQTKPKPRWAIMKRYIDAFVLKIRQSNYARHTTIKSHSFMTSFSLHRTRSSRVFVFLSRSTWISVSIRVVSKKKRKTRQEFVERKF